MDALLIGVDIGTQGTKTCLFDQAGRALASAFEPSNLIAPAPGAVEQSPDEIYGSVLRTIREVVDRSGTDPARVAGLGLDGQMAGILGVDATFRAVTPYDSWLDTRCDGKIREMKERAGDRVTRITGAPVSYAHGPKVLWWKDERPEAYRRIKKFVLPTAYVAGQLCGLSAEDAYIDYTCLHFSGFGDVQNLRWSDELLDCFGVDGAKMPDIVQPWRIVGRLTAEAARQCGLRQGTPVTAGAGDQAATSLGAGIVRPGLAFDVAGTASVFSCCVERYAPDEANWTILYARSVIEDLWIPLGYINGGGLCLRWIRDVLAGGDPNLSYDALAKEAEPLPPGSESLVFVPHFSGRVCPNSPDVRGSFSGLTLRHTRAHLYRAVMESIGYEYKLYHSILRESTSLSIDEVYVIGGGAKSQLFNQIKSDILGVRYTSLRTADTGPWGAALIAGHGVGLYPDLKQAAAERIEKVQTLDSDVERHASYAHYANQYKLLLAAMEGFYRTL